ncbi:Tad domain-containing protein [Tabrizicola sp. J26]|uniref:Tad domain-containing protein n=1 Tax=Alitabrizicola rongguiensis TaxID=2909234 RepID=UPI001F469801|nr:Tad domain-containing protein [Tabrizicola rongguiensis]MCF1708407.1 Tad domain-containing protein [Tabrizicola rongguiensis]
MRGKLRLPAKGESLKRFLQQEDGNIIVLGLNFLVLMLMMGGMAVDLMRYEVRRTELQQTTDRAALAAAALNQDLDAEAVVRDYFTKAGLIDKLVDVDVIEGFNSKSVEVDARSDLQPFFMHMMGVTDLQAPANSMAIERISDVEVSLVLDISGSMNSYSRITNLKKAAKEFIDAMYPTNTSGAAAAGHTTITIVPYSGQVNLGTTLMSQFNVTRNHTYSSCVDLPSSAFNSTTQSTTTSIPHAGSFDPFTNSRTPSTIFCPPQTGNTITPVNDDKTYLKNRIDALVADGNTSIDIGVKWGALFLDPGSNGIVQNLVSAGAVKSDYNNRPLDATTTDVLKIMVVMSDGENTTQYTLLDPYRTGTSNIYRQTSSGKLAVYFDRSGTTSDYYMPDNSSSTRWQTKPFNSSTGWTQLTWPEVWNTASINYVAASLYAPASPLGYSSSKWQGIFRSTTADTTKNTRLQSICTAAKNKGFTIFTIGFEAPTNGKAQLLACASSAGHYYDVTGIQISQAFLSIASQISHLRLTQ